MSSKLTAEEYLEQVHRLENRIECDVKESKRRRERAFSLQSPTYGDKVQHSFNTDASFSKAIDDAVDLERLIAEEKRKLSDLQNQVREAIYSLEDKDEQKVLSLMYLSYYSMKEIKAEMGCSRSSVYRKRDKALENLIIPTDAMVI